MKRHYTRFSPFRPATSMDSCTRNQGNSIGTLQNVCDYNLSAYFLRSPKYGVLDCDESLNAEQNSKLKCGLHWEMLSTECGVEK